MRFKVELDKDVVWFIRHLCWPDERQEFYDRLERLHDAPFTNTESCIDRTLSRYALRLFRFGRNIAVFRIDLSKETIRVRQCRRFRGKRERSRGQPEAG